MKTFYCKSCNHVLLFNSHICESCGATVAFDRERLEMVPLRLGSDSNQWFDPRGMVRRICGNHKFAVCNWLVEKHEKENLCLSCRFNRYVPASNDGQSRKQWYQLQDAKHRLIYSLLRADLPLVTKLEDQQIGLAFDFIDENHPTPFDATATTGHSGGRITINAKEAGSVQREIAKNSLGEGYRTLIGHFRHEVGHYYWEILISNDETKKSQFRNIFGDERSDYQAALQQHYLSPNPNWQSSYISSYASCHPWEDWAETWAHYFHIVDTADTAFDFGISLAPRNRALKNLRLKAKFDPYKYKKFKNIISVFHAMVFATNSLNRSMGLPDLYPFVITPPVREKLNFVHDLIRDKKRRAK
ncbi:MAG: putative zinc-binding metallopeptidase [Verrucomicrobiales bacterium]|nr:putative zinc-binding metallopeptidase [Verrucomicrobiales bacterium]